MYAARLTACWVVAALLGMPAAQAQTTAPLAVATVATVDATATATATGAIASVPALVQEQATTPVSAQTSAPAQASAPALEVLVLGSGGPGAVGRASSSFVVLLDGKARILVDAGPGSFARAGESHVALRTLDIVLLTHLHIDHVGELPGMLLGAAVSTGQALNVHVFGPSGAGQFPSTSHYIDLNFGPKGAYAYLKDFSAPLSLKTRDVAAKPVRPQVLIADGDLKISAIPGHHRDAPAVIYRIDFRGHSVTFSGDIDAQGLPALKALAQGTDVLVFNSVVLDPPASPSQLYELHTPPGAIGQMAEQVHAGRLLLNHLSPAVEQAQDAVLASIRRSYAGPVTFSADLLNISDGR